MVKLLQSFLISQANYLGEPGVHGRKDWRNQKIEARRYRSREDVVSKHFQGQHFTQDDFIHLSHHDRNYHNTTHPCGETPRPTQKRSLKAGADRGVRQHLPQKPTSQTTLHQTNRDLPREKGLESWRYLP